MNKNRQAEIDAAHDYYHNHSAQKELPSNLFMIENGHPFAQQYIELRKEFDRLQFTSNGHSRFVAYNDEYENCHYSKPTLGITPFPDDFPGFEEVWPQDTEKFNLYVKAAAQAGWPQNVQPKLFCGTFDIRTRNSGLVTRFINICKGSYYIQSVFHKETGEQVGWHIETRNMDYDTTLLIMSFVKREMAKWTLPENPIN